MTSSKPSLASSLTLSAAPGDSSSVVAGKAAYLALVVLQAQASVVCDSDYRQPLALLMSDHFIAGMAVRLSLVSKSYSGTKAAAAGLVFDKFFPYSDKIKSMVAKAVPIVENSVLADLCTRDQALKEEVRGDKGEGYEISEWDDLYEGMPVGYINKLDVLFEEYETRTALVEDKRALLRRIAAAVVDLHGDSADVFPDLDSCTHKGGLQYVVSTPALVTLLVKSMHVLQRGPPRTHIPFRSLYALTRLVSDGVFATASDVETYVELLFSRAWPPGVAGPLCTFGVPESLGPDLVYKAGKKNDVAAGMQVSASAPNPVVESLKQDMLPAGLDVALSAGDRVLADMEEEFREFVAAEASDETCAEVDSLLGKRKEWCSICEFMVVKEGHAGRCRPQKSVAGKRADAAAKWLGSARHKADMRALCAGFDDAALAEMKVQYELDRGNKEVYMGAKGLEFSGISGASMFDLMYKGVFRTDYVKEMADEFQMPPFQFSDKIDGLCEVIGNASVGLAIHEFDVRSAVLDYMGICDGALASSFLSVSARSRYMELKEITGSVGERQRAKEFAKMYGGDFRIAYGLWMRKVLKEKVVVVKASAGL